MLNGSLQQTFTYNSSNELVRVDDAVADKTVTYEYDYVGNITDVNTYNYTTGTLGAEPDNPDDKYNGQNQREDLSYDANGNLTELNGFDFTWDGRRLTFATSTDNSISYTYNHSGIRTSKTVNGTTTYYVVDENNNVVKQYNLVNDVETNVIKFVYDSNSSPIYMEYDGNVYYYEKNLQGDIVAILDSNGNTVVEYAYNIWGELVSITGTLADTIGAINPLRYRGYYYDTETGLYYLQSRYYSPDLMRFISQDDPVFSNAQGEPLGSNLYVYCLNNPVMNVDFTGYYVIAIAKIVARLAVNVVKETLKLSMAMYMYAISGSHFKSKLNLSSWYNPLGILLRERLNDSKFIKNHLKSMIRSKKSKDTIIMYFGKTGGNIADFDLSMSVGHAIFSFSIKKTNKKQFKWYGKTKYIVTLRFEDKYDFKIFTKNDAGLIKRAINNYIGYYPQEWKILKIYTYSITYTFDFYY